MAESTAFFAVKSIGLSRVNGRNPCTLLQAARHSLREIQAEMGSAGHIDPMRSASNSVLCGPAFAAQVQAQADALLAAAGIGTDKLRRDHCQAIEAVFSLPTESPVSDRAAYFARCLRWLGEATGLPVLSGVLHNDEAEQHLHVLLLPVKGRAHVGSAPIDRIALKRLRDSFFVQVAGPAGLKRSDAKVVGTVKTWAVAAVLSRCEALGLPAANGPLWPVLVAAIEREPTTAMLALGIDVNSIRPCEVVPSPNPIGIEPNPIGFEKEGPKHRTLSCVGFAKQEPLSEPSIGTPEQALSAHPPAPGECQTHRADAVGSLSALWKLVGWRSAWSMPCPSSLDNLRKPEPTQATPMATTKPMTPKQVGEQAIKMALERSRQPRPAQPQQRTPERVQDGCCVRIRDAEPLPEGW